MGGYSPSGSRIPRTSLLCRKKRAFHESPFGLVHDLSRRHSPGPAPTSVEPGLHQSDRGASERRGRSGGFPGRDLLQELHGSRLWWTYSPDPFSNRGPFYSSGNPLFTRGHAEKSGHRVRQDHTLGVVNGTRRISCCGHARDQSPFRIMTTKPHSHRLSS